MNERRSPEARFRAKVIKRGPNECWEWSGAKNNHGYGQIRIGDDHRIIYAHRLSYILAFGEILSNDCVCHKCDMPECTNPAHLFIGTHADNMHDAAIKLRTASGDRNGHRRYPPNIAGILSARSTGMRRKAIAQKFSVSVRTVDGIIYGFRWKGHVASNV